MQMQSCCESPNAMWCTCFAYRCCNCASVSFILKVQVWLIEFEILTPRVQGQSSMHAQSHNHLSLKVSDADLRSESELCRRSAGTKPVPALVKNLDFSSLLSESAPVVDAERAATASRSKPSILSCSLTMHIHGRFTSVQHM